MRDSWIDKKELEELVGEFSSSKGKSRKRSPAPRRQDEQDESGRIVAESAVELKKEDLEIVSNLPGAQAEIDMQSIVDDLALLEGPTLKKDSLISVENLEPTVHAPIIEALEEIIKSGPGLLFGPEFSDPVAPELEFGLFELDDDLEDEVEIEDEPGAPSVSLMGQPEAELPAVTMRESVPTGSTPDEGVVSKVTVESPSVERQHSRKMPSFLGGASEMPEPRQLPISVRDADRAINSLAEARAKVDESGLLQSLPPKNPLPDPWEIEPKQIEEVASLSAASGINEGRSITPEAGGFLYTRLENFGDSVQRELGASEVAVCDADGFLLYKSSGFDVDKTLHHSLLLQVSGRMNTLLGLGSEGVSQLTDGSGIWRCLISGNSRPGNLFAGFTLPKPLDQKEVETWKSALVETISPPRQNH